MATPAYLGGISNFLTPKQNKPNTERAPKTSYWNPGLGKFKVRFLKMKTDDKTPILPLLHYDKPLVSKRINAPVGWGAPDPINDQFETLRKTREGWDIAKHLRPRRAFYAAVLVRGEEDKGVRIWEVKEEFVKQLYTLMLSEENKNEDILDYNVGYDFEINVVPAMKDGKPKMYDGKPCKAINAPIQMRKPSPLLPNKDEMQALIDSIPDYYEQQRRWVKPPEDLIEIMEQFMVKLQETTPVVATSSDAGVVSEKRKKSKAAASEADDSGEVPVDPETDQALDEAFAQF